MALHPPLLYFPMLFQGVIANAELNNVRGAIANWCGGCKQQVHNATRVGNFQSADEWHLPIGIHHPHCLGCCHL